ncbi:MAG: dihydroorotate dehydrogenase electron transfer subunit [Solobacterium sp.]|nr:dihydroorotate dehydrogenase electron transfer subunit [Solobacterium sp.]
MRTEQAVIRENRCIAPDVYAMVLECTIAEEVKCGQFVQVEVPGFFLRRPISVCECGEGSLTLVYRTAGEGTAVMSRMKAGDTLSLFGPLGNGFPLQRRDVLLIGGGVGVPPLVETAKAYRAAGMDVTVCLGFADAKSAILTERFQELGCRVIIATMDGSLGTKGTVIDALQEAGIHDAFILACGPMPMLKAVSNQFSDGYISLEERMACGMGACMGCVIPDQEGNAMRICKDGPVFAIGKAVL